jgi:hypothetical protein
MLLVPRILRPTLNGVIAETTCSALEKLRRPTTLFRGFPLNGASDWSHNDHYLDLRFRQVREHIQLKDAISYDTARQ